MSIGVATLRKLAGKQHNNAPKPATEATKKLDAEGLWVNAYRSNALLLQKLCVSYRIEGLSIDSPPNLWELGRVTEALQILPASVLEEIKVIGGASVQKLHENAAVMRDQGILNDDETIVAMFMIANDVQIETAPVSQNVGRHRRHLAHNSPLSHLNARKE